MSRRKVANVRVVIPDAKFNSVVVAKLINAVMQDGNKSLAVKIVYSALEKASQKLSLPEMEVLNTVVENVQPEVEVCPRKLGGATYQVPVEVRVRRRLTLVIRWLIAFAKKRPEKTMIERLAGEIIDAFNKKGGAYKKKVDTHKMAEANKAFSHYRI